MYFFCCDDNRRADVIAHPTLNGIDFLEVMDGPDLPADQRQRSLVVHFLKPLPAQGESNALTRDNLSIEGGDRLRNIQVVAIEQGVGEQANLLFVDVDRPGDFSTYTLRLVRSADDPLPPSGFDRRMAAVDFSFKAACASPFDCAETPDCPPEALSEPLLDYNAKDFASFRGLILDRLAVIAPGWQERNPADLGIALVEMLAYVGDSLSYHQDAIATEAYLGTARKRVSVRRHARLVDYFMHDGCNARAWVHITPATAGVILPKGTQLFTRVPGLPERIDPASLEYQQALNAASVVFETMHAVRLYPAHDSLEFYTWGDDRCCLPKGARRASLHNPGNILQTLAPGMTLIFQEQRGPNSGDPDDADPNHRHAVRLTRVEFTSDPLYNEGEPPEAVQVVDIEWAAEDALPFPLCVHQVQDPEQPGTWVPVSTACGNVVLADHGRTVPEPDFSQPEVLREDLGVVPQPLIWLPAIDPSQCDDIPPSSVPVRYRPGLKERPVTQAVPYSEILFRLETNTALESSLDAGNLPSALVDAFEAAGVVLKSVNVLVIIPGLVWAASGSNKMHRLEKQAAWIVAFDPPSASAALLSDPSSARPAVTLLFSEPDTLPWSVQRDLLKSRPEAREFVVEVESDCSARLRFGDDRFGRRPESGDHFYCTYRVGNGKQGNVGANSIRHIVSDDEDLLGATNPLPARGGVEAETIEEVRQKAPVAFRTQERAVTPQDYARMAERHPLVQRAVANFRWTGSWRTVFITVDRLGGEPVDAAFEEELRSFLERFRMAGHDVEIEGPRYVALEIELSVCVAPGYFTSHVRKELLEIFSNRVLPNGQRGVFHPDNFTFGQPVYISRLYAAAQAVEGVASVEITTFRRQGTQSNLALQSGEILLDALEIARLDNDPNYPDHGILTIKVEGGQ